MVFGMQAGQVLSVMGNGTFTQPAFINPQQVFQGPLAHDHDDINYGQCRQQFQILWFDRVIDKAALQFNWRNAEQRDDDRNHTNRDLMPTTHAPNVPPKRDGRGIVAGGLDGARFDF